MNLDPPAPSAAVSPVPVGVMETDVFCERCGFNLHTRPVWKDPRLDILICQCPECGGHQPALNRTSAAMPWLHRLATIGLLAWIGIAVGFFLSVGAFCLLLQSGVGLFIDQRLTTLDGQAVHYDYRAMGTPGETWLTDEVKPDGSPVVVASGQVVYRVTVSRIFKRRPGMTWEEYLFSEPVLAIALIVVGSAGSLFVLGCLAAAGSWYWRRRSRLVWLALPVIAGSLAAAMWTAQLRSRHFAYTSEAVALPIVGAWRLYAMIGATALAQIVLLALGLRFGRPVARFAVRVFCPPRARQLFAFLWHCDGLRLPPANLTASR